MILNIISLALFIIFCISLFIKYGIQDCLSKYYYCLKEDKLQYLFTILDSKLEVLGFFCVGGVFFVAASPKYISPYIDAKVHAYGAIIAGISGFIIGLLFNWIIVVVLLIIASVLSIFFRKNILLFYELAAFLAVFLSSLWMN